MRPTQMFGSRRSHALTITFARFSILAIGLANPIAYARVGFRSLFGYLRGRNPFRAVAGLL